MFRQAMKYLTVLAVVLGAATGCQDLDIVDTNDPDRDRALANAEDLQSLVAGGFNIWFAALHAQSAANHFTNYATEFTSTTNLWGYWVESQEPRGPHGNLVSIPAGIGPHGPRNLWSALLEVTSAADDLMRATTEGQTPVLIVIDGVDQTPRAQAFAKFMQGLSWGYSALMFDQAMVIPDDEPFPITNEEGRERIIPSAAVLEAALEAFDAARTIVQANPGITFPSRSASSLWFGTPATMTSEQFLQLINTMSARLIVLNARTPEERAQVDWQRILQLTANGVTSDVEVQLDANRSSLLYLSAQNETPGCISCFRWDTRLVGQSDISGAYQAWIASEIADRNRFNIVTPDRRITGPTPTDAGAYTRWLATDGCCQATRGLYYRSAYQWRRHAHREGVQDTGYQQGVARFATVDENRLYQAEAHLHLNNLEQARDLINVTRTRSHTLPDGVTYPGLPPATVAGAPHSAPGADDCVPRTDSGACGNLHVVLRYERMIENAGIDSVRGYADSRGFGLLPTGSYYHLPVPANEAVALEMDIYTFGGQPGSPGTATYAPVGNP
jgi:starch-binding outer membrane protein, SusD/RagB family